MLEKGLFDVLKMNHSETRIEVKKKKKVLHYPAKHEDGSAVQKA